MQRYFKLYKVLWNWKRTEYFTVSEFSITFSATQPRKVLYDLLKLGLIERVKRNSYKVISPQNLVKEDYLKTIEESYKLLKNAVLDYSLTRTDAVLKWTKGGYDANRFFGFYPIEIKVKTADLGRWNRFLKSIRRDFLISGKPTRKNFFGVFYILYPISDFSVENLGGEPVDSLKETILFCQNNMANFEHALAMLNEIYGLKLKVRY